MKANLILNGFAQPDLRPNTLVSALTDEKKDYLTGLRKAISTIKDNVTNSLYPLFEEKTALEI